MVKELLVPLEVARDGLGMRIEQQLARVEAVTMLGLAGTRNPVAIELSWPGAGQVPMPHKVGNARQRNAFALDRVGGGIKQAKIDLAGVPGK